MPDLKPASHAPSTWSQDRAVMNRAVREAGAAVKRHFGTAVESWSKGDDSPVSIADHEANDILHRMLITEHKPDYGFLSEESTDNPERLTAKRVFIIDPIDGTRAFLSGRPHFTVCAALIENGIALASAVFNPATDEFFEAGLGEGALLNDTPIQASNCNTIDNCRMIAKRPMFEHPGWPRKWPQMTHLNRNSTNYRIALVAASHGDAAIALVRKADWDTAPGALIAQEAGAIVTDHLGRDFRYNQPDARQTSLVCAAPSLYPHIIERVKHLPEIIRP